MKTDNRVRMEVRVAPPLAQLIDDLVDSIGIRRNALFVIGVSKLAIELMLLYGRQPGAKRVKLFEDLEKQLHDALAEARKTL